MSCAQAALARVANSLTGAPAVGGVFAVVGNTPEKFAAMTRSDIALTAKLVKAAGIQSE